MSLVPRILIQQNNPNDKFDYSSDVIVDRAFVLALIRARLVGAAWRRDSLKRTLIPFDLRWFGKIRALFVDWKRKKKVSQRIEEKIPLLATLLGGAAMNSFFISSRVEELRVS